MLSLARSHRLQTASRNASRAFTIRGSTHSGDIADAPYRRGTKPAFRQSCRTRSPDRRTGGGRRGGRIGSVVRGCLFGGKAVILAAEGFEARIDRDDWQRLTARMTLLLGRGNVAGALHAGLEGVEALLLERGYRVDESAADELPNAVLQLKGER